MAGLLRRLGNVESPLSRGRTTERLPQKLVGPLSQDSNIVRPPPPPSKPEPHLRRVWRLQCRNRGCSRLIFPLAGGRIELHIGSLLCRVHGRRPHSADS